jgi:lantibiotic leader peptide-processing serine protease
MRRRRSLQATAAATVVVAASLVAPIAHAASTQRTFVVLADGPSTLGVAEAAAKAAGASVVSRNTAIGMLTVRAADTFADTVRGVAGVAGVAADRSIGHAPRALDVEDASASGAAAAVASASKAREGETYASLQWDMKLIGATPQGSYKEERGERDVRVGIIDTGIDGKHPDLAPNFSKRLSRNFVTDIPAIDGTCEVASCVDPVDEDDNGHGTHTAGTVAAAINGRGISGIAPDVTLVNVRAGQDSGFFFLDSVVNALTYSGDAGINVVNMSFYTDPWLYNCAANPADTPAEQAEQRTIIEAHRRALDYAHNKGVVLVSALGNEQTDLGHPTVDDSSPDYSPIGTPAHHRVVDNSCVDLPVEGNHVIGVSAIGPSTRLSFYSNYGVEQTDVAAPGGDSRDTATGLANPNNRVLSTFSREGALDLGYIDAAGNVISNRALKECVKGVCAYYSWQQGTSMASPHAVGVVALIISKYGQERGDRVVMNPDRVEQILFRTATKTACPAVNPAVYPDTPGFTPLCEGTTARNGFYGNGIVNALAAVSR